MVFERRTADGRAYEGMRTGSTAIGIGFRTIDIDTVDKSVDSVEIYDGVHAFY